MGADPSRGESDELEGLDLVTMSVQEEAGAILEAEMAYDLSLLRRHYEDVHKA